MTSQEHSQICVEHKGALITVTIDRPEKKNALTHGMWRQLRVIFEELSTDDSARAVILTGSGGSFCAGADISEFETLRSSEELVRNYEAQVDAAIESISACGVPTIAAVSGYCLGGGLAVAAACDFRIAETSALFGVPAARVGLVYNLEKCRRIFQICGLVGAKHLLYSGKHFCAEEALKLNFIQEITQGDPLVQSQNLAEQYVQSAPLSIRGMKKILQALSDGDVPKFSARFDADVTAADNSRDHWEAVKAFGKKRAPVFRGH